MSETTTEPTSTPAEAGLVIEPVYEFDIDEPFIPDMSLTARRAFRRALAAAQASFAPVMRTKTVTITPRARDDYQAPPYTYKYAELADVISATLSLSENGISVSQPVHQDRDGKTYLYTILAHEDGGGQVTRLKLVGEGDLKTFGGEITYLRRYCLAPAIGIASEDDADDDGNGAGDGTPRGKAATGGQEEAAPRRPAAAPPPSKPRAEKPYPAADFDRNFKAWAEAMQAGLKTVDETLKMIEQRGVLSDEQKQRIRDAAPKT